MNKKLINSIVVVGVGITIGLIAGNYAQKITAKNKKENSNFSAACGCGG